MKFPTEMRFAVVGAAMSAVAIIASGCGSAAPPTLRPSSAPSQSPGPVATPATPTPTFLATPDPNADPHETIVAVETRGGHCANGPCGGIVRLDRDGVVHVAAKPPNQLGVVPAEKMADLDRAIRSTDFADLLSHPFTGDCPTAYDGQELVVEVLTAGGAQRIEGCAVELDYDSPLFTAISAALGDYVPLLNQ